MASKLSSLPYHTKIVVGAPRGIIIGKVPEMLSIDSPGRPITSSIFNSLIEIFIKRYHKVDLVSMMRELLRTNPELIYMPGMKAIFPPFQVLRKGKNRSSSDANHM